MCFINFYLFFPIFNNNNFFYNVLKTHLKNSPFLRFFLKYKEISNFKSENICNFTSRKNFSKLIIVVIQADFAQNIKKSKITVFF
jgi:hypothetical protein